MAFGEVTGKEMKQDREYSITDEKVLALQSDNQILLSKINALSAEVEQLKELINNISRKE